jgi:hypothetical protein
VASAEPPFTAAWTLEILKLTYEALLGSGRACDAEFFAGEALGAQAGMEFMEVTRYVNLMMPG